MNSSEGTQQAPGAVSLPASLPGIEIADTLRRIGNKPALLFELLCELATDQANTPEQIRQLLAQGDRVEATRRAHSVKGNAMNLGCTALATAAQALESALKSGAADVDDELAAAAAAFAVVQASVATLRARLGRAE